LSAQNVDPSVIGTIRAGDFEPALDVQKAEETLVRLQEGRIGRRTIEVR